MEILNKDVVEVNGRLFKIDLGSNLTNTTIKKRIELTSKVEKVTKSCTCTNFTVENKEDGAIIYLTFSSKKRGKFKPRVSLHLDNGKVLFVDFEYKVV